MPLPTAVVVAPSGPFERSHFERGAELLRPLFDLRFDEGLFSRDRYLAGSDQRRAAELQAALDAPDAAAILVARGGYGAMRLLPHLRFPARVAPLLGFSDVTALHAALWARGHRSLHGPNLTQLGTQPPDVVARLLTLFHGLPVPSLGGGVCVVPGVVEGPLVGGNLAVLASLVGTPYFPSLDGCVLLLEDVGERPYRLDRLWTQLALSGALARVAGVVFGDFTGCDEKGADYGPLDVLQDLARALGRPCAGGFPVGHGAVNHPWVHGGRVRLDAGAVRLDFLESLPRRGAA